MSRTPPACTCMCCQCIVAVANKARDSILLWRYLQYLRRRPGLRRALLICEEFLVPFYQKAGFKEKGPAAVSVSNMRVQEMEYMVGGQAYARRNSGC